MTDTTELFRDPVVDEVRAIRRRLWAEAGNNVARFIEQLDRELPSDRLQEPAPRAPTAEEETT